MHSLLKGKEKGIGKKGDKGLLLEKKTDVCFLPHFLYTLVLYTFVFYVSLGVCVCAFDFYLYSFIISFLCFSFDMR